ncbi:MAG: hypothetical protein WCE75_03310 [Terracidiphilus sp.]
MVFRTLNSDTIIRGSSTLICHTVANNVFERSREDLLWLAEAILGNPLEAEACLADALARADAAGYVAPDWRDLWAKRCVVLAAIERDRSEIKRIAAVYSRETGNKPFPRPLSADDKRVLRSLTASNISRESNAFERAVLVLHGYLGFSIQDCAVSIDCRPSSIEPACSNTLWRLLGEETTAPITQEAQERELPKGVA